MRGITLSRDIQDRKTLRNRCRVVLYNGVACLLSCMLVFGVPSFAWATESGSPTADESELQSDEIELEQSSSDTADDLEDETVSDQDDPESQSDSIDEGVSAEADVAATPGWSLLGTCEWRIDETGHLTIRPANNGAVGDLPPLYLDEEAHTTSVPWLNPDGYFWDNDIAKSIKSAAIEGSIRAHESLDALFFCCTELRSITGCENIDLSDCKSIAGTFYMCGVPSLDLSGWDTSQITDMSCLFYRCYAESINLSGWNTSQVVDMSSMFYQCSGAASCDFSGFDTSNVVDMSCMFFDCGAARLDLSPFNTSNVTNMVSMFADNSSFVALDASGWDTSKVTNADNIFGYTSLSEVKIGPAFTLQSSLPAGIWQNTKGETFIPFDIPQGIADTYTCIQSYADGSGMVISESEKEVIVGCEPFQLRAYLSSTGAPASEWTSSDPRVASVDGSGNVTVHERGFVDIVARSGSVYATCNLTVQSFWISETKDSDLKGFLATDYATTAQMLAGCSVRIMKNELAKDTNWVSKLQQLLGADKHLVDVLDIDVVNADGIVIPFNDPDHGVAVILEDGYYTDYKSDDVKMEFHWLDSSGISETRPGDWFRDCGELMFDTTHLSTYAITASGLTGNDNFVSGDADLAQTGDSAFFLIVLVGISILSLEVFLSCSAVRKKWKAR